MDSSFNPDRAKVKRSFSRGCALLALAVAALDGIAAWTRWPVFQEIFWSNCSHNPHFTALLGVAGAILLILSLKNESTFVKRAGGIAGLTLTVFCAIVLLVTLMTPILTAGPTLFFFLETAADSPFQGIAGLALLGGAIFLLTLRFVRHREVSLVFSTAAFLIGASAVLGNVLQVDFLNRYFGFGNTSLPDATAIVLLAMGIIFLRPPQKMMAVLSSDSPGGHLTRRILPLAVLLPLMIGWLRLQGEKHGLYGLETGVALSTICYSGVLFFVIWKSALVLHRAHLQQVQTMKALKETSERYRGTFENAMEGIFQISPEGRLINCNPALANIYGYDSVKDILGEETNAWHLLHIDPSLGDSFIGAIQKNGTVAGLEAQATRRNGRVIWISETGHAHKDASGTILYYEGTVVDITRRKLAEEALGRSEHRFHTFMDNNPAVVFMKDEAGRYLYVNKTLERVFRIKREDIIGKSDYDWLPKDVAEETRRNDAAVLKTGKLVEAIERVPTENGEDRWWFSFKFPMDDPSGGRVVAGVSLDITERQEAELAMARARDMALQSTRMKSEFLANMSHEIRTPMNGLVGMADLLLGTPLTDRQADYAATIRSSADVLLDIINDILDFSKIEAGMLRFENIEFNLLPVVEDCIALLGPKAECKGLKLIRELDSRMPETVMGDPGRLRQVLMNLLGNAIKFTEKGEVSLKVEVTGLENGVAHLNFAVSDSGIGLSDDQISRLFKPFSQADGSTTRKYGGTGLGLAICKQLVSCMGGDIQVSAELGKGSVFSFSAPLALGEQGPQSIPANAPPPPSEDPSVLNENVSQLNVLLADDNPVNRKVAQHQLEKLGLSAKYVVNGREAVEAVAADDSIDVILMDCQMPVCDGYEATKTIRQIQKKPIYIIAMTAHSLVGDRDKCLASGMDDYVSKPVDLPALRAALARCPARSPAASEPAAIAAVPLEADHSSEPIIDLKKVSNDLGDEEFYKMVAELFVTHTHELLRDAKTALEENDSRTLGRIAHTIRGSCANFGAVRLIRAARHLESGCVEGMPDEAEDLLSLVVKEFFALEELLLEKMGAMAV